MSGVLFPDGGFLGYIDEDIELELLQAATAEEFTFHRLLGKGCNWVVFSASLASLPGREYALRMCYNDLISSAPGPIDSEEFAIMRSLRDCPSFVKLFSVFIDGLPMSARALLPSEVADTIIECGGIDRSCRFAVLQLYPSSGGPSLTLADFLTSFQPFGSVLPFHRFALIATNLLSILCALEERRILHGDIKLNNILLDTNLQLVLCDFGDAIVLSPDGLVPLREASGGNPAHKSPELRRELLVYPAGADCIPPSITINLSGQAVFEAGLLLAECVRLGKGVVIPGYGVEAKCAPVQYDSADCCRSFSELESVLAAEGYPPKVIELLIRMMSFNPSRRPTLRSAQAQLLAILELHSDLAQIDEQSSSSWKCAFCSNVNPAVAEKCGLCSELRALAVGWACSECQQDNAPSLTHCSTCTSNRIYADASTAASTPRRPWRCDACRTENRYLVTLCRNCGADHEKAYASPPSYTTSFLPRLAPTPVVEAPVPRVVVSAVPPSRLPWSVASPPPPPLSSPPPPLASPPRPSPAATVSGRVWQCRGCNFTNPTFRSTCERCQSPNACVSKGGLPAPLPPPPPPPVSFAAPPSPPPHALPWECGTCTLLNAATARRCVMCGSSNAPTAFWACSVCTFVNPASLSTCQMCNLPTA